MYSFFTTTSTECGFDSNSNKIEKSFFDDFKMFNVNEIKAIKTVLFKLFEKNRSKYLNDPGDYMCLGTYKFHRVFSQADVIIRTGYDLNLFNNELSFKLQKITYLELFIMLLFGKKEHLKEKYSDCILSDQRILFEDFEASYDEWLKQQQRQEAIQLADKFKSLKSDLMNWSVDELQAVLAKIYNQAIEDWKQSGSDDKQELVYEIYVYCKHNKEFCEDMIKTIIEKKKKETLSQPSSQQSNSTDGVPTAVPHTNSEDISEAVLQQEVTQEVETVQQEPIVPLSKDDLLSSGITLNSMKKLVTDITGEDLHNVDKKVEVATMLATLTKVIPGLGNKVKESIANSNNKK